MKLSEDTATSTVRVLLHGISGAGKSTLAAELAEHGFRLIWLDLENAVETLKKLTPDAQEQIELVRIPDSASFPIAAQTCLVLFKSGIANICNSHGKDKCMICAKSAESTYTKINFSTLTNKDIVVLDTGTQLSFSIMAYTMKDKSVEARPERDEWGALRRYTEFFKSQFQAAQYNLIVICQSLEAEIQEGITRLVPSFGSAGMSAGFGAAFGHVIYVEVKNGRHRAYSSSTASNKFLSRSRTGFEIEKEQQLSLHKLFVPGAEGVEKPSTHLQTPGEKAVGDLSALRAKLKLEPKP